MLLLSTLPLALLLISLTNYFLIRSPHASSSAHEDVGVLIPLRNEAENIEALVTNLAAQPGSFHFYLLDDNSEDGTAQLLATHTGYQSRFTVLSGKPLQPGWIGKTWALQQLFDASHEEILISIDADVRLAPNGLNQAVATLTSTGLDFISPYPRQVALTVTERLIQPLLQWSWLTTVPLRLAERSARPSLAVANGQFFVIRRQALAKINGYSLIKNCVIDDIFLARELIKSGSHGTVINGSTIAQCRMYSSWSQITAGYGKSLHKAFGSPIGAAFVIAFLFVSSIAPLLFGLAGNIYGWLGFFLITLTRLMSALKSRGRLLDIFLHPISVALLIYLILYSYAVRNTVQWKGRSV